MTEERLQEEPIADENQQVEEEEEVAEVEEETPTIIATRPPMQVKASKRAYVVGAMVM